MSQATLIFVLLFNRKRPGELERVLIDDYTNAEPFSKSNPDAYEKLSDSQKVIVDEYLRFNFGGKRNREIPILLSIEMQNYVTMIINNREKAGVEEKNPFIFGIPGFDGTRYKHLRACNLLRRFSKLCNAKYPERLRAGKLRKHFATTIASLEIDECRIYDISNFMGHHENIHRSHYRQQVVTRDVLGVSEFLEIASGTTKTLSRVCHKSKDFIGMIDLETAFPAMPTPSEDITLMRSSPSKNISLDNFNSPNETSSETDSDDEPDMRPKNSSKQKKLPEKLIGDKFHGTEGNILYFIDV